jgi:hypothetical protein
MLETTQERSPKMGKQVTKEEFEERLAKQGEEKKKKAQEREKANMKAAYVADGGTPQHFEKDFEAMQSESRRKRLLEREELARQESRRVARI